MKTIKPKFFIIILICSLFFALAGAALLFYSLNFCYNADIQHFTANAPTVIAYAGVCIASVIASITVYFTSGKYTVFNKKEGFSFTNTFFSILCACFSMYFGYMTAKNGLEEKKEFLSLLLIAFSFLSAIWFILDAFGLTSKNNSVKLLSFAPALMTTFITSQLYFTSNYAMNSSIKGIWVIMSISFMLYYIEYCGVILEAPFTARKYAATAVLSVIIGGSVSLSMLGTLIYSFNGFNYTLLTACLFVSLWLLSVFNFIEFAKSAKTITPNNKEYDGEIECHFKSEENEKNDVNAKEELSETSESVEDSENAEVSKNSESNDNSNPHEVTGKMDDTDAAKNSEDGKSDKDEDIYLPLVKFDDEDNKSSDEA